MELTAQIGGSVTDGLAYLGSLASLSSRAAYFTFVAPFRGKPLRFRQAVSQAMQAGVRALPILSLITFFIGLILALQSAYELRKFGAITFVANAVAISMTRELGPLITAIVVIGRSGSAFAVPGLQPWLKNKSIRRAECEVRNAKCGVDRIYAQD